MCMDTVSDQCLAFVQYCQTTIGVVSHSDFAERLSNSWTCFSRIPTELDSPTDRVAISMLIVRIALHTLVDNIDVVARGRLPLHSARRTANEFLCFLRS